MKLILRFIKPHWKLCAATILLLIVDVPSVYKEDGQKA